MARARSTFGSEITHTPVKEVTISGVVAYGPAPGVGTFPLFFDPGLASPVAEFFVADAPTTWTPGSAGGFSRRVTTLQTLPDGYPPAFQVAGEVDVLYDAAGKVLRSWEGPGGLGGASSWADLQNKPAPLDLPSTATPTQVRSAIGAAAAADVFTKAETYNRDQIDDALGAIPGPGAVRFEDVLAVGETPPTPAPGVTLYYLRETDTTPGGGGPEEPDAITFVAADFPDGTTSKTTATATIPASTQAGDFLLAVWTLDSGATSVATPAGWTLLGNHVPSGTTLQTRVYYRTAGSGDAGSVITGSLGGTTQARHVMGVAVFRAVDTIEGFTTSGSSSSSSTHATPTRTTAVAGCVEVALLGAKTGTAISWQTPAALTEAGEGEASGAGGKHTVLAYNPTPLALGTTVGNRTFTSRTADGTADQAIDQVSKWTLTLKPKAA